MKMGPDCGDDRTTDGEHGSSTSSDGDVISLSADSDAFSIPTNGDGSAVSAVTRLDASDDPSPTRGTTALQLTTSRRPFFEGQVRALERRGVDCPVLEPTGERQPETGQTRSVTDYLRFVPTVLSRSRRADLVHANYGLTAPAAIAQWNCPVVVSLWGSDLRGTLGTMSRWCARHADAVVVMSEEMATRLDVDCHVIPHGIDTRRFRPLDQAKARRALGWDDDGYHLFFPYSPNRPVKDYPRAERVVTAATERLDEFIELHAESTIPHDRMPIYMNAADALLLTSRSEGSPNSVKEALACNLPVIATDVGDVRDRLDGVEPSAVCRNDAALIESLVAVLRKGQRSNGRETIGDLTLERMGQRLLDVYETVLER